MLWFACGMFAGGVAFDMAWRTLYNATVRYYEDRLALDATRPEA